MWKERNCNEASSNFAKSCSCRTVKGIRNILGHYHDIRLVYALSGGLLCCYHFFFVFFCFNTIQYNNTVYPLDPKQSSCKRSLAVPGCFAMLGFVRPFVIVLLRHHGLP